jgi:hypothetical protein
VELFDRGGEKLRESNEGKKAARNSERFFLLPAICYLLPAVANCCLRPALRHVVTGSR